MHLTIIRINTSYVPSQLKIDPCNEERVCLLCGGNLIYAYILFEWILCFKYLIYMLSLTRFTAVDVI
jgi:hypothetical protein